MEEDQEKPDDLGSKSGLNSTEKKIIFLKIDTTQDEIQFRKILENDSEFKNLLNSPTCTICKTSLKNVAKHDIYRHPLMDILLCKSCLSFYNSGDFSLDEDDEDKYCRWCGQGGKIFLCSRCICGFCPKCIRRHFGSKKVKEVKNDEDWKCFVCDPEPLWKLRAICYNIMNPSEILNSEATMIQSTSSSKDGKKALRIEKEKKSSNYKTRVLRDVQKRSIESPSAEEMRLSDETQRKRRRCSTTVSPHLESSLSNEGKRHSRKIRSRTRNTSETPELARKILKSELPSVSPKSQIQCTSRKYDNKRDKLNTDSSDSDLFFEDSSDTESADESEPKQSLDESLGQVEEKLQDILKIAEVTSEFSLKTCRKKLRKFSDKNYKGTKENIYEEVKSIKSVILLLSSSLSTALNITNLLEERLKGQLEEHENDSVRTSQKNEDHSIDIASLLKMILEFMLKEKIKATYLLEIIDDICNKYHDIGISSHSLFSNFLKSMMKKSDINLQSAVESGINPELNPNDSSRPNPKVGYGDNNSHSIIIVDKDKNETSESIQKHGEEISNKTREDNSVNVSSNDAENIPKEPNESSFVNVYYNDSEDISKKSNENAEIVSSNAAEQISKEMSESNYGNVCNDDLEDISEKYTNEDLGILSDNDAENISKEPNESSVVNAYNDSEDISKKSNEESAEIVSSNAAEQISEEMSESNYGNVSNDDSEDISEKYTNEDLGILSDNDAENISKEPNDSSVVNVYNDSEDTSKKSNEESAEVVSSNAAEQISEEMSESNYGNVSNDDSEDISEKNTNEDIGIVSGSNVKQILKEQDETSSGNVYNDSEDISKKSNEENAEIVSNNDTENISKETNKNTFGNVSNIDSEVISENSNENRSRNSFINNNDFEIISKEQNADRFENNSSNDLEVNLGEQNENTLGNIFRNDSDVSIDFLDSKFGFDYYSTRENCMISNKIYSGQFEGVREEETLDTFISTAAMRKIEESESCPSDTDLDIIALAKIREELLNSESPFETDLSAIDSSSSDSSSFSGFVVKRQRHQKKIERREKNKRKKSSKSDISKEEKEMRRLLDFSTLERKRKVSSNFSRAKSADSTDSDSVLRITEKESIMGNISDDNIPVDETMNKQYKYINISDGTDMSDDSNNDRTVSTEKEYLSDEADISDNSTIGNWSDDDSATTSFIQLDTNNEKLKDSDLKTTSNQNEECEKDKNDETSHQKSSFEENISEENSSDSSGYVYLNKKSDCSWKRDKLLREVSDDTNSDEQDSSNKKNKVESKKTNEKSVYDFTDSDSSIPKRKAGYGGRKPLNSITSEDTSSSVEVEIINNPEQSPVKGRRNIKKILNQQSLHLATKQALKIENERKKRVAERNEIYNRLFPNLDSSDRLVLDFNPDTKSILLEVPRNLVKNLKPHQKQGVKFMWDCCFESLDKMKSNSGTGCILAHCMGLGKTLQVVTLIYTLLYSKLGVKTVLIVCPLNVLNNWLHEFVIWWKDCPRGFTVYSIQNNKKKGERYSEIEKWHTWGGVLILSYNMMRNLGKPITKRKSKKRKYDFSYFLHDPGPDVVVCDEGHLMKNEDSGLSKCIRKIKTSRRIVLTGTPFQNNLLEYYSMIQFVKPNFLGTKMEFMNRFGNPIRNGQFEDSTDSDVALMRARSHVLHKLLDGCIQRFNYNVAIPFLPEKHEYVISIQLTNTQATLYRHYIEKCRQRTSLKNEGCSLFRDFNWLHKLWTHPLTLVFCTKSRLINDKLAGSLQSNDELNFPENIDSNDETENLNSSKTNEKFWETEIKPEEYEDYKSSGKLLVLLSLLKYSKDVGDKVLVFSQSLYVLNLIEHFLKKINRSYLENSDDIPVCYRDTWVSGIDYYRLDGSTNSKVRSKFCKAFNKVNNRRGRLFLISTKAGGLGINLVGANRVVIFDVSWNPSYDVQSIFRVYRFGQKKPCYFYRFFAEGTMEEKIYERQVTKLSLEKRVLDEHQIERHYTERDIQELYKYDPLPKEKWVTPKLPKDVVLAEILNLHKDIIVGYHEHDSLLENKEEEELTEEERKAAWEDFETEKFWKETKNQKQILQPMNMPGSSCQVENDLMQEFWNIMSQYKASQVLLPENLLTESYQNYQTPSTSVLNVIVPQTNTFQDHQSPSV